MKVTIIGAGYVGLTTGVCLSYLGHEVTCLDTDQAKVDRLAAKKAPFFEPFLQEMLAETDVHFTTSYEAAIPQAEIVFIAVATPSLADGSPNLVYLNAAAQKLGEHLGDHFTVIVNKSTVPIGSGNWVDSIVSASYEAKFGKKANEHFAVASNPEFLREGSALADSLFPDRIVVGADSTRALERMYSLYRPLIEQRFAAPSYLPRPENMGAVAMISTDLTSAELIKYAANAFLALKISFINEVGRLAERVGADVTVVANGIGMDARIGQRFLSAGLGWGGSCFGKDTAALVSTAEEYGLDMPIVRAARQVNFQQREAVVEKLRDSLKILKGKTIGLLGLAFKPNTDDMRDAPALAIARKLIERGARVKAHDPVSIAAAKLAASDIAITYCETIDDLVQDTDALVLVTEWTEYKELDWAEIAKKMRHPLILDGRHALDKKELNKAGMEYLWVG